MRVQRQQRAAEDGYSSPLLPGVRASADAARLAEEIAFSNGRLRALAGESSDAQLPALYAEVRALASSDLEQATWTCFLIAYLCPLEGPEPFAGIESALLVERDGLEDLSEIALGPRTSHDPARGAETLDAYRAWFEQAGSQAAAFAGDPSWTAERRFERLFERLALPGFTRAARYELLVLLGALGLYELRAGVAAALGARGAASEDPATLAAKRVFAIGDPLLLERRAGALAEAMLGAGRRARAGARQLGLPASAPRSDSRHAGRTTTQTPSRAALLTRPLGARDARKCRPHGHLQSTVSAVSPPPRESRCHFASSSRRTPFE